MRTVEITTILGTPASRAWEAVTQPSLLCYVAAPVLRFPGLAGRIDPWREGEELATWLLLFGVVPVSRHHMRVLEVNPSQRRIATHEWGSVVRRWDHTISIEPIGNARCRYTDRIDIDAGRLTAAVVALAWLFYRHRQRRWRRLALRHLRRRPAAEPGRCEPSTPTAGTSRGCEYPDPGPRGRGADST